MLSRNQPPLLHYSPSCPRTDTQTGVYSRTRVFIGIHSRHPLQFSLQWCSLGCPRLLDGEGPGLTGLGG
ncbi:hypothetical protein FKM82_007327 [Ascaphus truei]